MIKKRASEIFAKVDPALKVIDGGTHRHRHKIRYSSNEVWEKTGGVFCSECSNEVVRLIDGLCPQCWQKAETERMERIEDKSMRRYYKRGLNKGTISLAQMREGHL